MFKTQLHSKYQAFLLLQTANKDASFALTLVFASSASSLLLHHYSRMVYASLNVSLDSLSQILSATSAMKAVANVKPQINVQVVKILPSSLQMEYAFKIVIVLMVWLRINKGSVIHQIVQVIAHNVVLSLTIVLCVKIRKYHIMDYALISVQQATLKMSSISAKSVAHCV